MITLKQFHNGYSFIVYALKAVYRKWNELIKKRELIVQVNIDDHYSTLHVNSQLIVETSLKLVFKPLTLERFQQE